MSKKKEVKSERLWISLTPDLHRFLAELAERNHRTMRQQVVALIDNAKFISENY